MKQKWLASIQLLLVAAVVALVQWQVGEKMLFSSYQEPLRGVLGVVFFLPLAMAVGVLVESILGKRGKVGVWLLAFLFLSRSPGWSLGIIAAVIGIFYLERRIAKSWVSSLFLFFLAAFVLFIPVLYRGGRSESWFEVVEVSRVILGTKLISWLVSCRIYRSAESAKISDFLDFIFAPFYFLFPTGLSFVTYDAHQNCVASEERKSSGILLAICGLASMVGFSIFFRHIWAMQVNPQIAASGGSAFWLLLSGMIYVVLFYFHHVSTVAFQVGLAKISGYGLRYDMNYPFLSRSPNEYWRRHHNYVREYLVDVGLRPLMVVLLRRKCPPALGYFLGSLLVYSLMMFSHAGYRPYFGGRDSLMTMSYVLYLFLFTSVPKAISLTIGSEGTIGRALARFTEDRPPRPFGWSRPLDYLMALGNFLLLSGSKALLQWAKFLSSS